MVNYDGFAGMLESSDIKKLDIISQFMGDMLNRLCGEDRTCTVTAVLNKYSEIIRVVAGYKMRKHRRNKNWLSYVTILYSSKMWQ